MEDPSLGGVMSVLVEGEVAGGRVDGSEVSELCDLGCTLRVGLGELVNYARNDHC